VGFGRSNRPASALHPCRRSSMDRAPVYEAGCSRFDPWRRHHLAVAQLDRAPLSEGGGRTFESCRRGSGVSPALRRDKRRPCSSTVEHAPGTGEVWVRPPARALFTTSPRSPGRWRDGAAPLMRRHVPPAGPGSAVVAQRTERPPPQRQGARSSRADGTTPRRRGGTATRLAFTQEIAGPTPAGGTSPTQPGGAHPTPGGSGAADLAE
jgi:hypothetical protein